MIRQVINVDNKWKVIVYYNIDYNLFRYVARDLRSIGVKESGVRRIAYISSTGEVKGFTFTSFRKGISVVGFNRHKTIKDYINTITHEAEHVKQHMLEAYAVADKDEPPAYTIGFLASKMIMFFLKMIKNNVL